MTNKIELVFLLVLASSLVACSKASPPSSAPVALPAPSSAAPVSPVPAAEAPAAQPPPTVARAVKTEMRNVLFHLTDKATARLETLSGEIWPTGKNVMPILDDKLSFEVRVTGAKISISPEDLSAMLNGYVFAGKDAPLKDLKVSIEKDLLIIRGKLHSKGDITFETKGTLSTTPEGRVRVHTEKMKALHVPLKGVMGVLGIELADVLNTSKIDGLETDKNDVVMDLGLLLPPPHIKGTVTAVRIERNAIITIFGDGEKSSPTSAEKGNYMTFRGGPIRFGKLIMESADVTVLDLDPGDALDWNQDRYREQLVAGYSKVTPNFGLRAYVKDYGKLPRSVAAQSAPAQ